jgi:hypothetical protein
MAPSLQQRFGLGRKNPFAKKTFDVFDDSNSCMSEEGGDLDVTNGSPPAQLNATSLEPTQEEALEDKEQAPPSPTSPTLSNEVAPSVLGRLLGKSPGSPRKSSKNSFQSAASRLSTSKQTQSNQSNTAARIDNTNTSEAIPQTPSKRKGWRTPRLQCKQSLLQSTTCDNGDDESLSDDDGYPSAGAGLVKLERLKALAVNKECEPSLSIDIGEVNNADDKSLLAPSLHEESTDSNCADLSSTQDEEHSEDNEEDDHNDPDPSETNGTKEKKNPMVRTSVRTRRRGGRKPKEPQCAQFLTSEHQCAQFMPSLMSDPNAVCEESEVSSNADIPTPTASSNPDADCEESEESEVSSDEDLPTVTPSSEQEHKERRRVLPAPSNESLGFMVDRRSVPSPSEAGGDKKEEHKERRRVLPAPSNESLEFMVDRQSVPSPSETGGDKKEEHKERRSVLPAPSNESLEFMVGRQSVPGPSEAIGNMDVEDPMVKASAKSQRRGGRRSKEPQGAEPVPLSASDPESESEDYSEDHGGYLPTAMTSSKSSRQASQSSLDHNEDDQSSEPSPLVALSQTSLDSSASDLRPDGTSNDEGSVFSLSALEGAKNRSSPAISLSNAEENDSTSKLDNSLKKLSTAFDDLDDGSQVNLYLAKVRQNRTNGSGEVDPLGGSVRSTRSSLSFSVTVGPKGETQSINVDTRLPTIESPTKMTRGRGAQGDPKIADMSDIDLPSFAVKSVENISKHSQRSRMASPKRQPRESPQIDPSEQELRSAPLQVSPRRQVLQQGEYSPKTPKTSRLSKSQHLNRTVQPDEDLSNAGPSGEQISLSQHSPSKSPRRQMRSSVPSGEKTSMSQHSPSKSPRKQTRSSVPGGEQISMSQHPPRQASSSPRKQMRSKVETKSQTDLNSDTKVSPTSRRRSHDATEKETGIVKEDVSPTSVQEFSSPHRRQQRRVSPTTDANEKETGIVEEDVSPTSVGEFSSPNRRHERRVTPTTPRTGSSRNLLGSQTPRGTSSRNLLGSQTPRGTRTAPRTGSSSTPRTGSSRNLLGSQTPRGTSSRNVVKMSDSFKKMLRNMGNTDSIKNLCSLKEDQEAGSVDLVQEPLHLVRASLQKANSTKNLSRSNETSGRTSSSRNLIGEKTRSSRKLVVDSPRKTSSSRRANPETPRRAQSSRKVVAESPRKTSSSRHLDLESPRKTSSSRNVNRESPRRAQSSQNFNTESLQRTSSSRNMKQESPLKTGRSLLLRAQSSRILPNSDWNYEPNRRHQVKPVTKDDPANFRRDAKKTVVPQLPSIDIC